MPQKIFLTQEQVMSMLYYCCRWGKPNKVAELLEEYPDKVDLFYYTDSLLFRIAMSHDSTDKCVKLLNILVDFYKKTKLQPLPEDSSEYQTAYDILGINLQNAYNKHDECQEVLEIIKPYFTEEEESENEQDLSKFGNNSELRNYNILHKSLSEPCLIQRQPETGLPHSSSESFISTANFYESDIYEDRDSLGQASTPQSDIVG